MNKKINYLALLGSVVILNGCGGTGNNTSSNNLDPKPILENPVRLDQLGVLPASNSSVASYLLQLTNYGQDKYTLDSVRVIDLATGKESKLVSVASQACSTVSVNGSCSIQLTPHTLQSADVKLEVNLKDKLGAKTKLVQLIRISGELSANKGGIVMLNDVSRIITEDGNYSLSIPVVLGEDYDEIKASNGRLICNTSAYQKGSSCTYQVSGKITGNFAAVSTRLEGIKAGKTASVQEASTKVEVAKGAHLLLSHGTEINHPDVSGEITVFNSGNTEATNVLASVEDNSGLKLDTTAASQCGTTLAANDSCKIKVDVVSINNGHDSLKVAYEDNGTNYTVGTNIRYNVANALAGIKFNEKSNNLANAIIHGKTREAIIEVENTGNRDLIGAKYYLTPSAKSGLNLETTAIDGCDLSGSAVLAPGAKCNVSIKYIPTVPGVDKTINFVLNSKYIDENGQSHSLLNSYALVYSATEVSSANLELKKISGNDVLSISNDDISNDSATWSLRNTLAADENLPASEVNIGLNPATIDGLKIAPTEPAECPLGTATINGDSACDYTVTYGPTKLDRTLTDIALIADYTLDSKALSNNAEFKLVSSAVPEPKITIEVRLFKPAGVAVEGGLPNSPTDPHSFVAVNSSYIPVEYKFINDGSKAAKDFNVDIGNLPFGTSVLSKDCPVGLEAVTFDVGQSCTVTVRIPDQNLVNSRPNLLAGSLNSAIIKLNLSYSYSNNGKIYNGQAKDDYYIKFSRLWTNVSHNILATDVTDSSYNFQVVTKVVEPRYTSKISYPITVTPVLKHPIPGVILKSCTIADKSKDSCINEISLPKDLFLPSSDLLVSFVTAAKDMNPNEQIISDYTIGGNITEIETEADLRAAFQGNTAGKVFVLGKDIALTQPWDLNVNLESAIFDGNGHKITNLTTESGFFTTTKDVVVKNLSVEGKVTNIDGRRALFINNANDHLILTNSNFKSKVSGASGEQVGGVIGQLYSSGGVIESVTIISDVEGYNLVGGFIGRIELNGGNFTIKDIRANTKVKGNSRTGGVFASFYTDDLQYDVKNIVVSTDIKIEGDGSQQIGGVAAATRNLNMSNIEANVSIRLSDSSQIVGAIVGNFSWRGDKEKLTNARTKGTIYSSSFAKDLNAHRIATVVSANSKAEVSYIIDESPLELNNVADPLFNRYVCPLASANTLNYENSKEVISLLPRANMLTCGSIPGIIDTLNNSGRDAEWTKNALVRRGFDFNNVWTIKKVDGVDQIGIKEDSIPQFPKW